MGRPVWLFVPFVGVLAYLGAPLIGRAHDAGGIYNVAAAVALVAYWLVFTLRRPTPALAWALVGVALTGWVMGDLAFTAFGNEPTVSVADGCYVVGYGGFIVATVVFLRDHTHERDTDRAIDATLIGIACFLFVWVSVISPVWTDPGISPAGRILSALYPVLDVVLLFFLVLLLLAPGPVNRAAIAFVVAVAAILAADVAFAALQQTGSFVDGLWGPFEAMWLVGYALLPLAVALSPDEPGRAATARAVAPTRPSRLAGLLATAIALVSLPTAEIVARAAGQPLNTAVLATAGGAIVVLVFTRLTRLHTSLDRAFEAVERQRRYYRAVADHASDSFVVLSPTGTVIDAAGSLQALVGYDASLSIGGDALALVHPDDRGLARTLLADALANPGTTVEGEVRVLTADGSYLWMGVLGTSLCHDPAIGGIVVNTHDITARKEAEAALEHRALHDPVTGLANRALFRDRLEHALARRASEETDVAVLFCDLDGFKLVNDTIGHDAGDEMLRIAAGRFANSVRPIDTLARIGGDEFAVLVESDGDLLTEADAIAARLLEAMAQPVEIRGVPMIVTTSIGIAVASGHDDGDHPDDLLRDADTAMYGAKAAGRNRAVRYDPSMRAAVLTHAQLRTDLRLAVERNELAMRYQPIVELASGRVAGFEALLRWDHPTRGMLDPDDFVPIAEETGAIVEVGEWALRTACRDAHRWGSTGAGPLPSVSVNVSGHQLVRPEFVDEVSRALVDSGLPAPSLLIEITESTLVEHTEQVAARLRALKAIGVRIAIDDFGVGQSSLAYLREFPVDVIKLDRSFVATIADPEHVPALIGGLLELARTLDLRSLAEGIETPAQREALAREGCELGQGFLFARPVDSLTAGRMLTMVDAPGAPYVPGIGGAPGRNGLMSPASQPPSTTNSPPVQ
jgi:diguanylate cyclase (GGDEF)-like protein/PAS domain S-box-containing protein